MLRTIGAIVVIGLIIGVFGLFRGWFVIGGANTPNDSRVTFALDKDKVRQDTGKAKTEFSDAMDDLDKKIDELKARAKVVTPEERAKLDVHVIALERQRDDLKTKIARMAETTGDALVELKDDIKISLAEIGKALDRAFAELKSK